MGDSEFAAIRAASRLWVNDHRERYLKSGGVEGHIIDMTSSGGYPFATHLLLKYIGRKSGKVFITPLCYGDIGGEVAIIASKGGADTHPAWYLNIREAATVDFQIATQAFRGTLRQAQGAERDHVWQFMVKNFPFYRTYQESTQRVIPLVLLKAEEAIPVFRFEEAEGWRE